MHKHTIVVAVIGVGFLLPAIGFAAGPTALLTWQFDEGEGRAVEDSVRHTPGTITAFSGWASGKSGRALVFDGKQGQRVSLENNLLSGTTGSLSFWIKAEGRSEHAVIFSERYGDDERSHMTLALDSEGRPVLTYRAHGATVDTRVEGGKSLNLNEWYQVVLTANSQTYRLFVNGEEVALSGSNTGRWFGDLNWSPATYQFGGVETTNYSGVLNGYLDLFQVYADALTLDQVRALYDAENLTTPTDPVGVHPGITLTASPTTVPFGGSAVLTWNTTDTTTCTASGAGFTGPVTLSGTQTLTNLGFTGTYGLVCVGKKGTTTASTVVNVLEKGATSTPVVAPSGSLTVTPVEIPSSVTLPPQTVGTMTPAEREAKIAYIRSEILRLTVLITELIQKLSQKTP